MAHEGELEFGDDVDQATFEQILEMDEDDGDDPKGFSRSIVLGFLEQAEQTFEKMEAELGKKDLDSLSSLGHFLKGSSATLGFTKVKDECEKIQHYGQQKTESGEIADLSPEKCLKLIRESLDEAKTAYEVVKRMMTQYYGEA